MACPFCGSQDIRRAEDGAGAIDWCQVCGRAWEVEAPPLPPNGQPDAPLNDPGLNDG